jgi:hypothetical protein
LGQVANGKDPAADLAESRAAITVADLAARYLQDEVGPKRKPGTAQLYGHYLNRFVVPEAGGSRRHRSPGRRSLSSTSSSAKSNR